MVKNYIKLIITMAIIYSIPVFFVRKMGFGEINLKLLHVVDLQRIIDIEVKFLVNEWYFSYKVFFSRIVRL